MAARSSGPLTQLFGGRRAGTTLMVLGIVLAAGAAVLVRNTVRASQAVATQGVRQVYVVMATQDIPEFTPIRPEAVAVKPFPAAFAPPGAAATVEEVAGKFSATRLTRDQIVLTSQVSTSRRSASPSVAIPPEKVAFWMPVPDLLSQSGGLQPGDHVDVLLSIAVTGPANQGKGLTSQAVLQNVEVFFVGAAGADAAPPAQGQAATANVSKPGQRVMAVLLSPQDAVTAKFIKDSGGTIDLVLRSRDWQDQVKTEAVNADTLVERFGVRGAERWSVGR